MKLKNKRRDKSSIKVLSKGKKNILVKKGFVIIVSGSHDGFHKVSKSVIKTYYEVPEDVSFR